jgi:CubicO group peptidase (beta-lactamase class C family)
VADGWMPGAAWWIGSATETAQQGRLGHAALRPRREAICSGTPFDLASLTKPLVTALLLVLEEQAGRLCMEQRAGDHLVELVGSPWERSSLLELATHSAGLAPWSPLFAGATTLEGYLRAIARMPPAVDRGKTLYSDLGYILLGAILARATGETLATLFRRRVVEPLGLQRTGFATGGARFEDAAATELGNGYERELAGQQAAGYPWRRELIRGEVHDVNAHALGGAAGHAGLFAPLGELVRLGQELLRPARLGLGTRARRRLLDVVPGTDGRSVGFVAAGSSGAARGILPDDSPGHTGFTGTSLWLEPGRERIYVLLTNRVHPHVGPRSFQRVRRGFHRLARRVAT